MIVPWTIGYLFLFLCTFSSLLLLFGFLILPDLVDATSWKLWVLWSPEEHGFVS